MKTIKIACVGGYVPCHCGTATFTRDLVHALINNQKNKQFEVEVSVTAVKVTPGKLDYPEEVTQVIRADHQRDYLEAVKSINLGVVDVCLLQHDFDIFGGDDGAFILSLVRRLRVPLVVTFHSVPEQPPPHRKKIIRTIAEKAQQVIVMGKSQVNFLKDTYEVPEEKISLIPHGVPDFSLTERKQYTKKLNLQNRKTLITFGLLTKFRGIETVIKGLPRIMKKHPEVFYIVLGTTHPETLAHSGESYRNYLKRLVERNYLSDHVYIYDHYVEDEELLEYLSSADICITPYSNPTQVISGTLAYAVGAGAVVVSTPFRHAREMLANERGRLVEIGDQDGMAATLIDLLDHPDTLEEMRRKSHRFGRKYTWPKISLQYMELLQTAAEAEQETDYKDESVIDPSALPEFILDHVERLTDGTGILRYAKYMIPDFKGGYSLQANARSLLMSGMAFRQKKSRAALKLIPVYLGFLHFMQNSDGTFKDWLPYNRQGEEEKGSEETFGMAVWALGFLLRYPPGSGYFRMAQEMFFRASPNFEKLYSLRGLAYTIIGLCHYLERFPKDEQMKQALTAMTEKIMQHYQKNWSGHWHWFEPQVLYASGTLPLALLHSAEITGDRKVLQVGLLTMEFLERVNFRKGFLSLLGDERWYERDAEPSEYAQRPLDAMSMVLLSHQAYVVTQDPVYLHLMYTYFMWFLGDNDLGEPLYDFESGGCSDGLERGGISQNQGAESTLAYLIAHLTVLLTHE